MNHLIQQGKVLYWGTSEWSAQEIMEAHMIARERNLIGPTMEQPIYNLFAHARIENNYQRLFETFGLGTTTWSTLSSWVLTEKYLDEFPDNTRLSFEGHEWLKKRSYSLDKVLLAKSLNELALDLGTTLPKLSIAWCAQNQNVSSVILGASSLNQLKENLDAQNWIDQLTPAINQQIDEILGGTRLKRKT